MAGRRDLLPALDAELAELADQLRCVLAGDLGCRVTSRAASASVRELAGLINAVVASAQRAVLQRDRERAELLESERRHRDYIANTPYGVFATDEQGHYVQVNPAATRITGYSEAELLGMSITDLVLPEDQAHAQAVFHTLMREGQASFELPFRRQSGEYRWWAISAVRLSPTRTVGFCNDISERKAAEAALRESQAVLSGVLNAIPVRVFWKDRELRYLGCNLAFALDAGYASPEDLVGKDDYAMAWRENADRYRADDREIIASETARLLYEEPQTTASGERFQLLTSKLPLRDAVGTVIGVLGTYHDVTPLRRAEAEKRRLEMQLRQSQKLQAVGQLAAGIAHEINTPAQFVGDSIEFLRESQTAVGRLVSEYRRTLADLPASPALSAARARLTALEAEADIDFVLENAPAAIGDALDGISRVSKIVRAMKEFAHPDQAERAPADLNRALEATLTIARNEYKYVADVETDFGDLPLVDCHLGDLNQVFLNLLVNAAHAIGDVVGQTGAKGRILVRTRCTDAWACIEIADTGAGIPDAVRDRIFEPFFTTKAVGKGSGQGLAIAHAIVVGKHGGRLDFETTPGQGTTFSIRLPLRASAGGERAPEEAP